jgi:hypothetical protein
MEEREAGIRDVMLYVKDVQGEELGQSSVE